MYPFDMVGADAEVPESETSTVMSILQGRQPSYSHDILRMLAFYPSSDSHYNVIPANSTAYQTTSENGDENHVLSESANTVATECSDSENEFDVYTPMVRSVFVQLKNTLNDMDAIYHQCDGLSDTDVFLPSEEMIVMKKNLDVAITYFKGHLKHSFNEFAQYEQQCRKQKALLAKSKQLLQTFEEPAHDHPAFNACAKNVLDALNTLSDSVNGSCNQTIVMRNYHWRQFSKIRDMCKHVAEIHADPVCSTCYQSEIGIALTCGHTMCEECAHKVTICPTCRVFIKSRTKIYL